MTMNSWGPGYSGISFFEGWSTIAKWKAGNKLNQSISDSFHSKHLTFVVNIQHDLCYADCSRIHLQTNMIQSSISLLERYLQTSRKEQHHHQTKLLSCNIESRHTTNDVSSSQWSANEEIIQSGYHDSSSINQLHSTIKKWIRNVDTERDRSELKHKTKPPNQLWIIRDMNDRNKFLYDDWTWVWSVHIRL
jgi:hypothetical protein